jgi:hypothetical protein
VLPKRVYEAPLSTPYLMKVNFRKTNIHEFSEPSAMLA